jgi:hypothetical protein
MLASAVAGTSPAMTKRIKRAVYGPPFLLLELRFRPSFLVQADKR